MCVCVCACVCVCVCVCAHARACVRARLGGWVGGVRARHRILCLYIIFQVLFVHRSVKRGVLIRLVGAILRCTNDRYYHLLFLLIV